MSAFDDGRKIAAWNIAHGSILGRTNDGMDGLIAAIDRVQAGSNEESRRELRDSGAALLEVANEGLMGPFAGVPSVDDPRREALKLFSKAGSAVIAGDPDRDGDPAIAQAAQLLTEGKRWTAQANTATQAILAAVLRGKD